MVGLHTHCQEATLICCVKAYIVGFEVMKYPVRNVKVDVNPERDPGVG